MTSNTNHIISLLLRFQNWWNLHVYKGKFTVYTKPSYSHNAEKKALYKTDSIKDAESKIKELQSKYKGVLFFYE